MIGLMMAVVCGLASSVIVIRWQRGIYASWMAQWDKGRLRPVGCSTLLVLGGISIVLGIIIGLLFSYPLAMAVARPLLIAAVPPQRYDGQYFDVISAAPWKQVDPRRATFPNCLVTTCLLTLDNLFDGVRVQFMRIRGNSDLAAVEKLISDVLRAQLQETNAGEPESFTLDGQPALRREITYIQDGTHCTYLAMLAQMPDNSLLRFDLVALGDTYTNRKIEFMTLIDSVRFSPTTK